MSIILLYSEALSPGEAPFPVRPSHSLHPSATGGSRVRGQSQRHGRTVSLRGRRSGRARLHPLVGDPASLKQRTVLTQSWGSGNGVSLSGDPGHVTGPPSVADLLAAPKMIVSLFIC